MKKIILLLVLFFVLILTVLAAAARVAVFPDILKPDSITVDNGQFIITEGASISLFSLRDFSLQKKFGNQGEGPQEFKVTSYGLTGLVLDVQPRVLLVSSVGKLSLFTREGKFIKEMKASHNFFGSRFLALGQQYVGLGSNMEGNINYMTVNIYDGKLNKVKEICRWESPYRLGAGTRVFTEPYVFCTSGDKILTTNGTEFTIDVYDSHGENPYTIKQEYKKLKISRDTEKAVINYFKTNPATKNVFQYMQPIIFPDYLPAIRNFMVTDKKVYVLTFKRQGNKSEFYIFDLEGKLLNHVFLPLKEQTPLTYFPYYIKDGKLYQLVENEEEEEWELYVTNSCLQ
jgi:hypothetical protein